MTIQALFIHSNQALLKTVSQIADDQWDLELPPGGIPNIGSSELSAVIRRHTYDDAWVPDVLAGKTIKEVGDTYEHLLSASDVKDNYSKYDQRANDAVRDFKDLDKVTHLSYGDFSAKEYLLHIVTFRAFRSYDIAKLIGANTAMEDDLVLGLTQWVVPAIEDLRAMGVFPPAVNVSADAKPQQKLLAITGRK